MTLISSEIQTKGKDKQMFLYAKSRIFLNFLFLPLLSCSLMACENESKNSLDELEGSWAPVSSSCDIAVRYRVQGNEILFERKSGETEKGRGFKVLEKNGTPEKGTFVAQERRTPQKFHFSYTATRITLEGFEFGGKFTPKNPNEVKFKILDLRRCKAYK